MNDALNAEAVPGLAPWSLKDAPAFIERQFPVGRLSAEAYKERDAGQGQTLTALGSLWKGRKPLILVRAVVLGCLLPASDDLAADLEVFLKLMAMDDAAFGRRYVDSAAVFSRLFPTHAAFLVEKRGRRVVWRADVEQSDREGRIADAFSSLPYKDRLKHVNRPEQCDESKLLAPIWREVNRHLGTQVRCLSDVIDQLGSARFGHRPKVADAFCGGGSTPPNAVSRTQLMPRSLNSALNTMRWAIVRKPISIAWKLVAPVPGGWFQWPPRGLYLRRVMWSRSSFPII
jgi:putative DNA methylase